MKTSLLMPASLASVDIAVRATVQLGESVSCMDVHTAQQTELEPMVGGTGDVTFDDAMRDTDLWIADLVESLEFDAEAHAMLQSVVLQHK